MNLQRLPAVDLRARRDHLMTQLRACEEEISRRETAAEEARRKQPALFEDCHPQPLSAAALAE